MHETLYALSEAFSTRRNKSVLSNQVPFEFRRPVGSRWDFLEPVRCQGGRWTWERPNQIPHSDQSRSRFCCMIDSRAFYWPTPHPTHPPMSRAFPTDPYNTPSPTTTQPEVCLIPNSLTSIPLRAFCTSPLKNGLKVKWVKADLKKKIIIIISMEDAITSYFLLHQLSCFRVFMHGCAWCAAWHDGKCSFWPNYNTEPWLNLTHLP